MPTPDALFQAISFLRKRSPRCPMPVRGLPVEILEHVLAVAWHSPLPDEQSRPQLFFNLASVCRTWYGLMQQVALRYVYIESGREVLWYERLPHPERPEDIPKDYPYALCRSITFQVGLGGMTRYVLGVDMWRITSRLTRLERLHVAFDISVPFVEPHIDRLMSALRNLQSLVELEITCHPRADIVHPSDTDFSDAVAPFSLPSVVELTLCVRRSMFATHIIRHTPNIRKLHLINAVAAVGGLGTLATKLEKLTLSTTRESSFPRSQIVSNWDIPGSLRKGLLMLPEHTSRRGKLILNVREGDQPDNVKALEVITKDCATFGVELHVMPIGDDRL